MPMKSFGTAPRAKSPRTPFEKRPQQSLIVMTESPVAKRIAMLGKFVVVHNSEALQDRTANADILASIAVSDAMNPDQLRSIDRVLENTWPQVTRIDFDEALLLKSCSPTSSSEKRFSTLMEPLEEHAAQGKAERELQCATAHDFAKHHAIAGFKQRGFLELAAFGLDIPSIHDRLGQTHRSGRALRGRLYEKVGVSGFSALIQKLMFWMTRIAVRRLEQSPSQKRFDPNEPTMTAARFRHASTTVSMVG